MTTFPQILGRLLGTDPGRPLVTFYDDDTGERTELSATTWANWVAKVSSLLCDELDLEAGDRLLVVDAPPVGADPLPGAPSSFGATVVRVGPPDVNGTVVVDVAASAGEGPALATRAATGRPGAPARMPAAA